MTKQFDYIRASLHTVGNKDNTIERYSKKTGWEIMKNVLGLPGDVRIFNLEPNFVYRQSEYQVNSKNLNANHISCDYNNHNTKAVCYACFYTIELSIEELEILTRGYDNPEAKRTAWAGFKNKFLAIRPITSELEILQNF